MTTSHLLLGPPGHRRRRGARIGRPARLLAAVVVLALTTSTLAVADDLVADGDGLTPVVASTLDFGTVCRGATVTKDVALAIAKKGGGGNGNRYDDGANVAVTVTSIAAPLSAPASVGTIRIPGTWSSVADETMTPSVTSKVTLTPSTVGPFTATVRYQAQQSGGTPTKTSDLPVRATVTDCTPQDRTPPTLMLPDNQVVEATGPTGATVSWAASASDAAPLSPAVTCTPSSGSTFAIGTKVVSCSATDTAGNGATGTFEVTVRDTTAPTIAGTPADLAAEAAGPDGAVVSYTAPTATDLVDGARPTSCLPASGSTFPLGSTTVTCTSSDSRNNTATSTFTVLVSDETAPVLMLPANVEAEATGPSGAAVTFAAAAHDDVDGSIEPTCDPAAGTTFALGATMVTCDVADAAGNASSGTFTVTVVDTTPPTLSQPKDMVVEGNTTGGADVTLPVVTAEDLVLGQVDVSCDAADGFFGLGVTTVTCSATDGANAANVSYEVTVVDTTAPVLTLPADQRVEAQGPDGATVDLATATATDVVDDDVEVTCDEAGSTLLPLGTTAIECVATDDAGLTAIGSYVVLVEDTTGPRLTLPADRVVEATGSDGALVDVAVGTATDLVDGNVDVTCAPSGQTQLALGTSTIQCTASDDAGNASAGSYTIEVEDTTAPTITAPAVVNSGPTSPSGAVVTFTASATDLVSGTVPVSCATPAGNAYAFGDTSVTCTATDGAGNVATAVVVVRVSTFTLRGFHQPVDMGNVVNTVKGGSTVPLKFEVFGAGGTEFSSTAVVTGFTATRMSCATGMAEDAIEVATTGQTVLRYDVSGGQFIQNWQTPKQPGTCWTVSVSFTDGTSLSARFKLK